MDVPCTFTVQENINLKYVNESKHMKIEVVSQEIHDIPCNFTIHENINLEY